MGFASAFGSSTQLSYHESMAIGVWDLSAKILSWEHEREVSDYLITAIEALRRVRDCIVDRVLPSAGAFRGVTHPTKKHKHAQGDKETKHRQRTRRSARHFGAARVCPARAPFCSRASTSSTKSTSKPSRSRPPTFPFQRLCRCLLGARRGGYRVHVSVHIGSSVCRGLLGLSLQVDGGRCAFRVEL